jgi:HEAT repeat protein
MSTPITDAEWQDPYPQPKPPRFPWLRKLWLLPAFLLVALAVLVVLDRWHWPEDPEYQGRRLSSWMTDLSSPEPPKVQQARQAVLALGTNAVPILVVHLGARDSMLGKLAVASERFLPRPLWVMAMQATRSRDALERRTHAARALAVLGPAAILALPDLGGAIQDPEPRVAAAAAEALRLIGPPAWPALLQAIGSTNEYAFRLASSALLETGAAASNTAPALVDLLLPAPHHRREHLTQTLVRIGSAAVPPLGERLVDPDPHRREIVATTLTAMVAADYQSLRAVVRLLDHPAAGVRAGAARILAVPAVWGRTSIAALTKALQDAAPEVRLAAVQALAATTEWTDQATNALPALRALAGAGAGPEPAAAAAAIGRIEARAGTPPR